MWVTSWCLKDIGVLYYNNRPESTDQKQKALANTEWIRGFKGLAIHRQDISPNISTIGWGALEGIIWKYFLLEKKKYSMEIFPQKVQAVFHKAEVWDNLYSALCIQMTHTTQDKISQTLFCFLPFF